MIFPTSGAALKFLSLGVYEDSLTLLIHDYGIIHVPKKSQGFKLQC